MVAIKITQKELIDIVKANLNKIKYIDDIRLEEQKIHIKLNFVIRKIEFAIKFINFENGFVKFEIDSFFLKLLLRLLPKDKLTNDYIKVEIPNINLYINELLKSNRILGIEVKNIEFKDDIFFITF
ncbi:MAG: hypothetical protein A2033_19745 [Bacteroidetes bacterium GWA2_31_9]|nr:MAG: hypothetical protein A2033_19745 [Bacteroidetes bacterium GWA2_31_9]